MASDSVRRTATPMMTFTTADARRKARHQCRLKRALGQRRDRRRRRVRVLPVFRRMLRAAMRRGIRSSFLTGKAGSKVTAIGSPEAKVPPSREIAPDHTTEEAP